jgi:glycosyltransferase involved in cell wall biosynthesis
MPKVSVLLPNLNNSQYLPERFQSILNQTFADWELIVVDGYSTDGAWEIIQQYARFDNRIRARQATRKGIYEAINSCLDEAMGDYIYIATSDDTMTVNCLQVMLDTLELYQDCDIAHCCLTIIDSQSNKILPNPWEFFYPHQFYGELMNKSHIRYAPLDGILHCFLNTVYTSLTQLMIRKTLFSKVGLFSSAYGSWADFGWGMKAGLLCNTIHIPQYLATWRVHAEQATASNVGENPELYIAYCRMIEEAIGSSWPLISVEARRIISKGKLKRFYYLKLAELLKIRRGEASLRYTTTFVTLLAAIESWKIAVLKTMFPKYSFDSADRETQAKSFCNKYGLANYVRLLQD